MSPLESVLRDHPLPRVASAAGLVMLLMSCFLGWAAFAKLDEVAVAPGEVVPQGQVKVIQHLEGGIIEAIHVREGQRVAAGDPLIQLSLGLSGANRDELEVQIKGLMLKRARLQAEAEDRSPVFPADLGDGLSELVRNERTAFENRRRERESALSVLERQTRQRALAIRETEAKKKGREASLALAERRLALSTKLLKEKLVPMMEHLQLESEVQTLRAELLELASALPKLREALAEAEERERTERLRFRSAVVEELAQVELAIARNRELLAKATDQVRRTAITSPIAGVVKNLRYHTIGGVVRPGEPILEIVPSDDKLVVEARLAPADVGYVRVGQPAVVKVVTYDFVRYGGLDGRVVVVAPDSTSDRDGKPYFRVVVETARSYMGAAPGAMPIMPGMETVVDIHTGERTVLSFLVSPVLKLRHEAFRER